MINRRRIILGAAGSATLAASGFASRALAQTAPGSGKLVRVMNGFPPGGSADVVTRMITDRLRAGLAPTAIVENRPGGGGRTVLEHARTQDADGTSIVLTPTAMLTIFPHVYKNLGYDITSLDVNSGELRLIEVKGQAPGAPHQHSKHQPAKRKCTQRHKPCGEGPRDGEKHAVYDGERKNMALIL